MPDVAVEALAGGPLAWVGMEGVSMPVLVDGGGGATQPVLASIDAFVNLTRGDQRGIHMSRLYRLIDEHLGERPLNTDTLQHVLRAFLQSHHELASRARIRLRFELPLRRKALRSDNYGWRAYPVTIEATLDESALDISLATEITYSSTCPASAALARQAIQQRFSQRFPSPESLPRDTVLAWIGSEQGIPATPHAQRSVAYVSVKLTHGATWDAVALIDRVEASLGTSVQTAVKREDEQAFALANGSNLMFCEDAARRIQRTLNADDALADFHIRVAHFESLHAHNAVACAKKTLPTASSA